MTRLLAVALLLMMGGCSMLDTQEVGTKDITYYDTTGQKTHTVTESVMVGDKPTEYFKAAVQISANAIAAENTRVNGILTATAPQDGDDEAVIAWKGATAAVSIALGATNPGDAIEKLHYGKDRYDNADTGIKTAGGSVIPITFGVTQYKAMSEAGGETTNTADNGSTVSTAYEEHHATAMSENAVATNQPNQDNSSVTEIAAEEEEIVEE